MALRILASFILLLSVFFMPFWATFILAILAMAYFKNFIEALVIMFLVDLLYGTKQGGLFGLIFISFFASIIVFLIIRFAKTRFRFDN